MKKLVIPEINNKLFMRKADVNNLNNKLIYDKNFLINNAKNFKLIKNLIELELFLGQRPKIIANYVKKALVINLKVTPNSIELLTFLQKSPVVWKKYLVKFNVFDNYNLPPFSCKSAINIRFNKLSNYQNWLKSAYLD